MHRNSFHILQDIGHLQHEWIIQIMVSRICPFSPTKREKVLILENSLELINYNDQKSIYWKSKGNRIYHTQVDSKVLQIMWKDISFRLFDILSRIEDLHSQMKHYSSKSIHFTRYLWLSILIDPQRPQGRNLEQFLHSTASTGQFLRGQGGYLVWVSYSPNIVI